MNKKTFKDFIKTMKDTGDRENVRNNNHYIEINECIESLTKYLNQQWSFTSDEHKAYKKILPILFCLKKVKLQHEPIQLTINELLFYLEMYGDKDLIIYSWTNFQIKFASIVLINLFIDKMKQ